MTLPLWILAFAATAVVLTYAGVQLARAGDEIAERTGVSRLFVGMLLVAGATSLPEIATDVSAALAGAPDLAVGDMFGSSMSNMAILAVIDLLHRGRVWHRIEVGHARVASIAIALTALATVAILTPPGLTFGWVGADTIAITVAYVAAVAWMRRSPIGRFGEAAILPVPTGWTKPGRAELQPTVVRFVLSTIVILFTGPVVALAAREIAAASGLGETFVGTALVGITTSLPELVASVAAVRIGAYDLAVGNLFGSNAANMALLVVADAAYVPGPLLHSVESAQAVGGVGAILLMSLALAAIVHGTETRVRRLEPDAVLLLLATAGVLYAVYTVS